MDSLFLSSQDISRLTSLSCRSSSFIIGTSTNQNDIMMRTNNANALYINNAQDILINTSHTRGRLNIGNSDNHIVCYHNNDLNKFSTIAVDSTGSLRLSSVDSLYFDSNIYILGQKLESSANELNYLHQVIPGTSTASRAMVTNSSNSIGGISDLSASTIHGTLQTAAQPNITKVGSLIDLDVIGNITVGGTVLAAIPIPASSGGTGFASYQKGDVLFGDENNQLSKLPAPPAKGFIMTYDNGTSQTGARWGYKFITDFARNLVDVRTITNTQYEIGPFFGKDSTSQHDLELDIQTVDLNNIGQNGISQSPILSGTIYPAPNVVSITGTGTLFNSQLIDFVSIQAGGEFRRVVDIINNTTITIDTPFTLTNRWELGANGSIATNANSRFGGSSFQGPNSATSNITMLIRSPDLNYTSDNTKLWTIEFYVRIVNAGLFGTAYTIISSSAANRFRLLRTAGDELQLSLGNGTTFNIANNTPTSQDLAQNTYVHIAIVFGGTFYRVYQNGTQRLNINSTEAIDASSFNSLILGANGNNFNGNIDEFRFSRVARYTANFTAPTAPFTFDANTISLNHFDTPSSATQSDESTLSIHNQYQYRIDGGIGADTLYYGYGISSSTNPSNSSYIFSSSAESPTLPLGFDLFTRIPFFAVSNELSQLVASRYCGSGSSSNSTTLIRFLTPVTIVLNDTTTPPASFSFSLLRLVPSNATSIILLITHNHLTANTCGVLIGSQIGATTLLTTNTPSTIQIEYTLPIADFILQSRLTAVAGASNYSLQLCGFHIR